jgi:hypothetical protein
MEGFIVKLLKSITLFSVFLSQTIQGQEMQALYLTYRNAPTQMKENPKKVHIFIDLHNVLVEKNPEGLAKRPLNKLAICGPFVALGIGSFFDKRCLIGLGALIAFSPARKASFWNLLGLGAGKTIGRNKVIESFFNNLDGMGFYSVDRAIYNFIKEECYSTANDIFKTNHEMVSVLKELKGKGCKLHLFSNIGPNILQNAKDRKLFPEVFELLNGENTTNIINQEMPENGTYTEWKPQGPTFDQALSNAEVQKDEFCIMIDDKLTNLPIVTGCELAEAKAQRKGVDYTKPKTLWTAGILHNPKNHHATLQAFKDLGLLSGTFE